MQYLIDQVDKDKLYLEIKKYKSIKDIHLQFIRQYDEQEPEIKFEAYLSDKALNNLITQLQKFSLYQKDVYPLEPDPSKNFGQH
jgi:hypothetical protein